MGGDVNESNSSSTLIFYVNGKKVVDKKAEPEWTLLYYLRNKLRLCGTKLGCAEGGCGACTVMVSRVDRATGELQHMAVNACLAPVCSLHGLAVTTVEGIGSTKTTLHPVQQRLALSHGSQCGFCTPGIVMSMYALLRSSPRPSLRQLEIAFQGTYTGRHHKFASKEKCREQMAEQVKEWCSQVSEYEVAKLQSPDFRLERVCGAWQQKCSTSPPV